jgi:hypothetical protein
MDADQAELELHWRQAKPRTREEVDALYASNLRLQPHSRLQPHLWPEAGYSPPPEPPPATGGNPQTVVEERKGLDGRMLQRMGDGRLRRP